MIFKKKAEDDFNVKARVSPEMEKIISVCYGIYSGHPYWVNGKDGVKTINFAKSVCSETARLTTLAIGITINGSARATWLQSQIDAMYFKIRHWVEYGCAYGTVFLKPNGTGIDVFTPADVLLIEYDNLGVKGIIFRDSYTDNDKYYTRLEYHRFEHAEDGTEPYIVTNKAYVSNNPSDIGKPVSLSGTVWSNLMEETPPILKADGSRLDGPLFGMMRTPQANNKDLETPMGLPVYAEAIEELRDLDVAYSRNANEKNLITGTRYMNVDGMLPFENEVADYVASTGNHVLYRVTPAFVGSELVARGVEMEALPGPEIPLPGGSDLARAMAALPARYRQALLLRFQMGYTTRELAGLFGMTEASAGKLLWRAKQALKGKLEEVSADGT